MLISPIDTYDIDWMGKVLPASVTREQVRKSPDVDLNKPVSRQHEVERFGYYGYPFYWGQELWGDGLPPGSAR